MKDIKNHSTYLKVAACTILFCMATHFTHGQQVLQPVPPSEYQQWNRLLLRDVDPKGLWISYLLMYESRKDTLFVKATTGTTQYSFPGCRQGTFSGNQFSSLANDTLYMQNLVNGSKEKIPGVRQFRFAAEGNYLILLRKHAGTEVDALEIRDRDGKSVVTASNIENWYMAPHRKWLVYSALIGGEKVVRLVHLDKKITEREVLKLEGGTFEGFASNDNILAFIFNNSSEGSVYRFDCRKLLLSKCPPLPDSISVSLKIATENPERLQVSDDGKKVFFWLQEQKSLSRIMHTDSVQVWNTKDRLLVGYSNVFGDYSSLNKLAVWDTGSGEVKRIGTQQRPKVFLNGTYSHAFTYDPIAYEPQSALNSPIDLYVTNLSDGKETLIKDKLSGDFIPKASKNGQYLCYFNKGDWWLYNIRQQSTRNLTLGLDSHFAQQDTTPAEPYPYGFAGYTNDGNHLILYDKFDLWLVGLNDKTANRITSGRENNRIYRIAKPLYGTVVPTNELLAAPKLDLEKGLLLTATSAVDGWSGYSEWKAGSGLNEIVWQDMKVDQVTALGSEAYVHVEQSCSQSPSIVVVSKKGTKATVLETNPQAQHYLPQKAVLIRYSYKGQPLSGILYYPVGYEEGKKYPMIVHIYEKQSHRFNEYRNPSLHSGDGFNIPHMCNQGYFVLLPDLYYEFGKTAKSITGTVLAAVDAAIDKAGVDGQKVGLIGHSFGGYETDLIITQTDRFAAAVSGAAWTDLISSYFYMGATLCKPDYYRAEYDQLRIGKSIFEDMQGYLDNSPVLLAEKVTTPLLGWTGEDDRHIHALQSMEFYLALRRLNKEHVLLVYPGEGHNLNQAASQEDLNRRISQWFGHYLKNGQFTEWMKPDY